MSTVAFLSADRVRNYSNNKINVVKIVAKYFLTGSFPASLSVLAMNLESLCVYKAMMSSLHDL